MYNFLTYLAKDFSDILITLENDFNKENFFTIHKDNLDTFEKYSNVLDLSYKVIKQREESDLSV